MLLGYIKNSSDVNIPVTLPPISGSRQFTIAKKDRAGGVCRRRRLEPGWRVPRVLRHGGCQLQSDRPGVRRSVPRPDRVGPRRVGRHGGLARRYACGPEERTGIPRTPPRPPWTSRMSALFASRPTRARERLERGRGRVSRPSPAIRALRGVRLQPRRRHVPRRRSSRSDSDAALIRTTVGGGAVAPSPAVPASPTGFGPSRCHPWRGASRWAIVGGADRTCTTWHRHVPRLHSGRSALAAGPRGNIRRS